ncbi:MAG: hypothetical protein ACE5JT_04115 [Nitrosopumilaceae archaeon]
MNKAKNQHEEQTAERRDTVKINDGEVERLRQEITNLRRQVEIEDLKIEIAKLRTLRSQKKPKRKSRK